SEQVFVDGNMLTLAQWPNTTTSIKAYPSGTIPAVDISHPAKSVITSFVSKTNVGGVTIGVVTDTNLPVRPPGFYEGAQIFFQPNNGAWSWAFSGVVSNVTGSQLTLTTVNGSGKDFSDKIYDSASRYYLFNKKEFLDAPGEWWQDTANGRLYAIMPDSGSPVGHTVEVKKRDFAFDLSGRSYITVKGLHLFACTITTDTAAAGNGRHEGYPWRGKDAGVAPAHHIVLDGLDAKYLFHFTDTSGHFYLQWGQGSGIILSGSDCVLQNSRLQFSAGNGVTVLGQRNQVLNNFFYDLDYAAVDGSAICTGGASVTVDHEIAFNTIARMGRSGITPRSLQNSNPTNLVARIHHNDISECMLQDWDGGGIYATADAKFVRIDHNLVHDISGFTSSGIYPDFSRNYVFDHNVIWNVEWGIHIQGQVENENNVLCYNNTIAVKNTCATPYGPFGFGNSNGKNNGTVICNNLICCLNPKAAPGYKAVSGGFEGAEITNNLAWDAVAGSASDPKFVDAASFSFQLSSNSPARDAGAVIPIYVRDGISVMPFSDATDGKPVFGAYEFGAKLWRAGATSPNRR
ncbi:MAG: right-handed parallel beta-helix repeat-containing protein, partial [Verrucomicrobiota bacterium]